MSRQDEPFANAVLAKDDRVAALVPELSTELLHKAVAMLQRDGVPPCDDGHYRLYTRGLDYRLSTTGVLETDAARKVRRFNERATSRTRRTSWRRRALDGMMRLLNRSGRLGVYRA